jgi:hypothetical protein
VSRFQESEVVVEAEVDTETVNAQTVVGDPDVGTVDQVGGVDSHDATRFSSSSYLARA